MNKLTGSRAHAEIKFSKARQKVCASLIADSKPKQIGRDIDRSYRTAEWHIYEMTTKSGLDLMTVLDSYSETVEHAPQRPA